MKHTILFLAANPHRTDMLALDREARAIYAELDRSGSRDSFELLTRWAVEPLDLLREMRKLRPTVVHFCGHGGRDMPAPGNGGRGRDVVIETGPPANTSRQGLVFQGADGRPQVVSAEALQRTFDAVGTRLKLVVLNACYTDEHAVALINSVDCVVGMRGSIRDDAARSFAVGFYGGLGERESIANAYKQGCAAISLEGLNDADRPQLRTRAGVDAAQLILTSPSRASQDDHAATVLSDKTEVCSGGASALARLTNEGPAATSKSRLPRPLPPPPPAISPPLGDWC
jgi:hypothetical protein